MENQRRAAEPHIGKYFNTSAIVLLIPSLKMWLICFMSGFVAKPFSFQKQRINSKKLSCVQTFDCYFKEIYFIKCD